MRYGDYSPYEAAAVKKREENLQRIKEMGMYKYSLVCIHKYVYTQLYIVLYACRVMHQQRTLTVVGHQHHHQHHPYQRM